MLKAMEKLIASFTGRPNHKSAGGSRSSFKVRKARAWRFVDGNYSQYWCRSSYTGEIREYHYGVLMRTWVTKQEMSERLSLLLKNEKSARKALATL